MDEGINEKIISRYCELQEKYQDKGGYIIEEEIDKLTSYFMIDKLKEKSFNSFVFHDRYFINNIASKIMFIKDKQICTYIGNYDDYCKNK